MRQRCRKTGDKEDEEKRGKAFGIEIWNRWSFGCGAAVRVLRHGGTGGSEPGAEVAGGEPVSGKGESRRREGKPFLRTGIGEGAEGRGREESRGAAGDDR